MTEVELLTALTAHDALVRQCVRNEITWSEFEAAYDSFYSRYALDGHESDEAGHALLRKHEARIALHREIWNDVIAKVTDDEHLGHRATLDAGFIGSAEAIDRLRTLANQYLR